MKFSAVLLIIVALAETHGIPEISTREKRKTKKLSDDDIAVLDSVYNFRDSSLNIFKIGNSWQSDKFVSGDPEATAYLLVPNDKCVYWSTIQRDAVLLWHGGKATIDKIDENGQHTADCLGDPLEDDNCDYLVYVPAGWKADVWTEGFVYFSKVVMLGSFKAYGKADDYDTMLATYPDLEDVIKKTEPCYGSQD